MKRPLIKNANNYDDRGFRLGFDKRTLIAALVATAAAVGVGVIFSSIYPAIVAFVAVFMLSVGRIEGMSIWQYIAEDNRQIRRKDYAHSEERLLLGKKNTKGK